MMAWTIEARPSDEVIDRLYDAAGEENLFDYVGYDMEVSRRTFHLIAKGANVFAAVMRGERPLAFFFLSNFVGRTAELHFCFLKAGRPYRLEIGRAALQWCFNVQDRDCLISVAPVTNFAAVNYARQMGGRSLGRLRGYCFISKKNVHVDGQIFIFERSE